VGVNVNIYIVQVLEITHLGNVIDLEASEEQILVVAHEHPEQIRIRIRDATSSTTLEYLG